MPLRSFKDDRGQTWEVWEVRAGLNATGPGDAPALPAGFENGWLAFEGDRERRRLAPVPEGWDSLPEARLQDLLHEARLITPARRLVE